MSRLAVLALAMLATSAMAADGVTPPLPVYVSGIYGHAGQGMTGLASINLVAGRGNAQANLAAITLTPHGAASASGRQTTAVVAGDVARGATAHIGDDALSSGSGVLAVNQASGAANAQINLLVLGGDDAAAHMFQNVDVTALAAVASGVPLEPDAAPVLPSLRDARIDGAAFANPQGVLQLNQTAGVGNASANAIVLQIPGGTP